MEDPLIWTKGLKVETEYLRHLLFFWTKMFVPSDKNKGYGELFYALSARKRLAAWVDSWRSGCRFLHAENGGAVAILP